MCDLWSSYRKVMGKLLSKLGVCSIRKNWRRGLERVRVKEKLIRCSVILLILDYQYMLSIILHKYIDNYDHDISLDSSHFSLFTVLTLKYSPIDSLRFSPLPPSTAIHPN